MNTQISTIRNWLDGMTEETEIQHRDDVLALAAALRSASDESRRLQSQLAVITEAMPDEVSRFVYTDLGYDELESGWDELGQARREAVGE